MSEFDFDELDKAVNNLMSSGNFDNPPPKKDDEPVIEITSTTASVSVSKDDAPAASPRTASVSPSNRSRVAPRRAGRFMDVMHESSDMKTPQAVAPSQRPSRQAPELEPSQDIAPVDEAAEVRVSATKAVDTVSFESDSLDEDRSADVAMPDPIDFAESQEATKSLSESQESISTDDSAERPYSPFVPDAHVEKRPLGGAATSFDSYGDASSQPIEVGKDLDAEAENQLPAEPEVSLPEEFKSDLMAIESDSTAGLATKGAMQEPAPDVDTKETASPAAAASESPVRSAVSRPVQTSIAPQYQTEPKQSDQAEGDIFNTESYHQPLKHPVKRKSGWLTVLLILLLIALGVLGGVLVYLFVL